MGNRKPLFLLAGHARNRDSTLEAAVASAGVPRPAVAYIGAASGDSPAFYAMMRSALMRAGAACVEGGNWLTNWCFIADWKSGMPRAEGRNVHIDRYRLKVAGSVAGGRIPSEAGPYRGLTAHEVTRYVMDGRRNIRESVNPDESTVMLLPTMADLRTTRRLRGAVALTPEDDHRHTADSIGCVGDWRKPGPVFEVPFGSLYDPAIANMLAAGRCTAAVGDAWEITRVIPTCALTGQAAGTAAAMTALSGQALRDLPVAELQGRLSGDGVMIHYDFD